MKKIISLVLSLTLVFAVSVTAFAADVGTAADPTVFSANTARTDVSIIAGADATANLSATVPLNVTLAVKADKTVVAPTNYAVNNTGSIAMHVSGVSVAATSPYTFTAEEGANTLNLTLKAGEDTLTLANGTVAIGLPAQWNVAAGENLPLTFAGSVGNITADISTNATKAFTVTYTIAAGIANNG